MLSKGGGGFASSFGRLVFLKPGVLFFIKSPTFYRGKRKSNLRERSFLSFLQYPWKSPHFAYHSKILFSLVLGARLSNDALLQSELYTILGLVISSPQESYDKSYQATNFSFVFRKKRKSSSYCGYPFFPSLKEGILQFAGKNLHQYPPSTEPKTPFKPREPSRKVKTRAF